MTTIDVLDSRTGTRMSASSGLAADLASPAERADVVAAVAAAHAVAVDRDCRFPAEAMDALRRERLLGMMVPRDLGGEGADVAAIADVCYRLGRACASTALIFAMHQTKVACVVRHGRGSAWHERLLRRLSAEEMLWASSTTEGQGGGNVRSSTAPVDHEGERISLERDATVISYGAEADAIVSTARRSNEASSSDQVLVVLLKQDYSLERLSGWDTLGMRGTCSAGFRLRAGGDIDQILPVPYDKIHAQTMTPVAHLLWSAAWSGIAAAAVSRAQVFTRKAARQAAGQLPPGAAHYTKAQSQLRMLRSLVQAGLATYQNAIENERLFGSLDFQTTMTLLKVDASELSVATVMSALRACGLSGYRNDGEGSIGRHLRDVLSAPIMINNDRILANLSTAALMSTVPASLAD